MSDGPRSLSLRVAGQAPAQAPGSTKRSALRLGAQWTAVSACVSILKAE